MKRKQFRFIGYFLVIGLVASLTSGMSGCGSKTTTTTLTGSTTSTAVTSSTLSSIAIRALPLKPINPGDVVITAPDNSGNNLPVDDNQWFSAIGTYSDGKTMDLTHTATWISDNTAIATISYSGMATGITAGTTNITATLDGITSPVIVLTIKALVSIEVTPASPPDLKVGVNQEFTATGTYTDGSWANITGRVKWASDKTIATLNSQGLATGVAPGTTDITATMFGITGQVVKLTVVAP